VLLPDISGLGSVTSNLLDGKIYTITNQSGSLYNIFIQSSTPYSITTPSLSSNLINFQSISDGSLNIDVDGSGFVEYSGMDFTTTTSIQEVASVISSAIVSIDVLYNSETESIIFRSKNLNDSSNIEVSTSVSGTDIYTSSYLNIPSSLNTEYKIMGLDNIKIGEYQLPSGGTANFSWTYSNSQLRELWQMRT
jgi:hypothetical protein